MTKTPNTAPTAHAAEYRSVTQADLDGFATISGDDNPIHTDPAFAATTPFAVPVAHGMFLFSLVRAELRRRWPSARLREQRLMFPAPTPVGSAVAVSLEVLDDTGSSLRVRTQVTARDGTIGLRGECVLDPGGVR